MMPLIWGSRLRVQGRQYCGFWPPDHKVCIVHPSTLRYGLITCESSRGPGTAFLFALTLVGFLCGPEKRKAVSGPMVFPEGIDW